jgi:hypothetical protein
MEEYTITLKPHRENLRIVCSDICCITSHRKQGNWEGIEVRLDDEWTNYATYKWNPNRPLKLIPLLIGTAQTATAILKN